MKYDIFVSYRRTDRELVAQVVRKLEERGASVWYDAEIEGGADWRENIVAAIEGSEMMVIFFSEACNQSRQLKKELAIADDMEKPVVPILIENTKPKGAYLYELADRNWLQAFPDPFSHIDRIVEHLLVLANKADIAPAAPEAPAAAELEPSDEDMFEEAPGAEPAMVEPAPAAKSSIGDMFGKAAPKAKQTDYIGKKTKVSAKVAHLNDILPFRWIDLVFLIPLMAAFSWFMQSSDINGGADSAASDILAHVVFQIALIGLYGALVFPFRYYLRRRRLWTALGKYALSSLILYAALIGAFVLGKALELFPHDDTSTIALVFGIAWIVFAVIAFVIYGILGAQRMVRSFRSNLQKV